MSRRQCFFGEEHTGRRGPAEHGSFSLAPLSTDIHNKMLSPISPMKGRPMTTNTAIPQKLYLLPLSTCTVPLAAGQRMEMVTSCYLVETSDRRYVLIDSGMAADARPPGTP